MADKKGHLTTESLVKILDALVTSPRWAKAMATIRASETLAFRWRAQSMKAHKENDTSSIFFLEWRGAWDFWHCHAGRARTENIILHEATIRDQSINGVETVVHGPDQKILYRENPRYIGRDDDFIRLSEGLDAGADVRWYRLEHDAKGHPIPLTKIEQLPAPLRLAVLKQDKRYIDQQDVNLHVTGEIQTAKPLQRLPGEERPDIARLRALAALPPAQRREQMGASAVPLDTNGRRTIPAPTTLPPARDARPSYARPAPSLDTGEGTGRGVVPDGGMKMA